jgi:hypothetical protein
MWFLVLCAWLGCSTSAAAFVENPNELTGLASFVTLVVYFVAAKLWFKAIDEDWELKNFTLKAQAGGLAARSV